MREREILRESLNVLRSDLRPRCGNVAIHGTLKSIYDHKRASVLKPFLIHAEDDAGGEATTMPSIRTEKAKGRLCLLFPIDAWLQAR